MSLKKILLGSVSLIILILVGLGTYIYLNANKIAEEIVRDQLIKDYNQSDQTKYLISLEEIKINILNGSVDLINVSVIPKDSLVTYESELSKRHIANTSVLIHIDKISLENFDYQQAITNRKIIIEKFEIIQPSIDIFKHMGLSQSEEIKQDTVDFKGIFLTNYDTFMLEQVLISNASSTFYNISEEGDTVKVLSVNHISYQINNILAHEKSLNALPYIEYGDFKLHSKNIAVQIHNKAELKIKTLTFESETNQINISNFELNPLADSKTFFNQLKYRKAWIKLQVKQITINKIDYDSWINSEELVIENIELVKPILTVKSNANYPFKPNQTKPMLGSMLTSLPINYNVNKISISNAQIDLELQGKISPKPGLLTFDKMNIEAQNLTNIQTRLDSNSMFSIKVKTRVNKTGDVNANLKIDLADPASKTGFFVDAKNLKLKKFNPVLEPSALISIKNGTMVSLKLRSTLSAKGGQGTMDAHFENLKLLILSKGTKKESNLFLNVVSGLANGYMRNNNIPGESNYHSGKFSFTKSPNDSFFKMLWICNLLGIEDSILGSNSRDNRQAKKKSKESRNNSNSKKKKKIFK